MPIATPAGFPLSLACGALPRPFPMPAFALTIFTGAFLLFQVQPLIGKYILPWFGGSPGVWTTCMLFFQVLLLGGYAYAHFLSRTFRPRTQAIVHLCLLVLALVTLPITPAETWKAHPSGDPTWHILALLGASLGLPYLVLAATGPLMQEWFRRTSPGVSPYRLYSLSNVGSLLALVSYPFFFETRFTRQAQAEFWSWGLVFYAAACAWCAWSVMKAAPAEVPDAEAAQATATRPAGYQRLLWVALPACASILLLAVTNKMCQDVAVIPFLWVLPLALYLLSFIISFDSPRWYSRFYYTLALAGAMVAVCYALFEGTDLAIVHQVVIYSATLFVGCMICHGELYRLKPDPRQLTSFYLMISAGGAVGGLFVALVAPYVFTNFYEMHLSLGLTVLLLLVVSLTGRETLSPQRWRLLFVLLGIATLYGANQTIGWVLLWWRDQNAALSGPLWRAWSATQVKGVSWLGVALLVALVAGAVWWARRRGRAVNWHGLTCALLAVGLVALSVALGRQIHDSNRGALFSARNFYGVLSVFQYQEDQPESHYYLLQHGRITHGIQFAAPEKAKMITSYFGAHSGLGLAFRHFPREQNRRVGLLGLGVGTLASYGKPGDYFRIYEINPQVKDIAEKPFSYIARSDAKVDIIMGDGRLSMEQEEPQNFDILIMDAFSSDAVPVHLLTKEAFEIYTRHLKPDGVILVNISNRYLDLRPVVENVAKVFGFRTHHIESDDGSYEDEDGGGWWLYAATWMILSKNDAFMDRDALRQAASPPMAERKDIPLWTDDYTSMFKVLIE
jgi:hypothetical protein